VSIWDYETETFKTPVYGGSIVDNLVGRQKTFSVKFYSRKKYINIFFLS